MSKAVSTLPRIAATAVILALAPAGWAQATGSAQPSATGLSAPAYRSAMVRSLTSVAASPSLGKGLSGIVVDMQSGATVWATRAKVTRLPASTQKLMTTFTVLRSMSPATTFTTRSYIAGGTNNTVVLVGDGDPSLGSTRLKALAAETAASLKSGGATTARVYINDSVFPKPSAATGWKSTYLKDGTVQLVRGLTMAGYRGPDGGAATGAAFVKYLAAYGVPSSYVGRAGLPAGSRQVSASSSASVRALLSTMLSVSNNDFAEYLLRQAARAKGLRPTWKNSITNQRRLLAAAGVPLKGYVAYDGSGLSRADRMPVATLASVIRKLYSSGSDNSVVFGWGAIPRSGQTGTLANRFKVTAQACAQGQVLAKTGTLSDVVGLAGVARSTDGRDRAFVFLENAVKKTSVVRKAIDSSATAVVGCRLG